MEGLYRDDYPILSVTGAGGRSIFPDGYFDLVVSDQVFEHVADLDTVASEIARVLRPNGLTCHQFPAKFRVVEPHYKLPLVHWLPKNGVRRAAIEMLLRAGLSGEFFPDFDVADRTKIIFKYSVEETFYRPIGRIAETFRRHGLPPSFRAGMHPYVESRLRRKLPSFLPVAELVATSRMVMFTATKSASP